MFFKVVIIKLKGIVFHVFIPKSNKILGKISDALLLVFHILALNLSFAS